MAPAPNTELKELGLRALTYFAIAAFASLSEQSMADQPHSGETSDIESELLLRTHTPSVNHSEEPDEDAKAEKPDRRPEEKHNEYALSQLPIVKLPRPGKDPR